MEVRESWNQEGAIFQNIKTALLENVVNNPNVSMWFTIFVILIYVYVQCKKIRANNSKQIQNIQPSKTCRAYLKLKQNEEDSSQKRYRDKLISQLQKQFTQKREQKIEKKLAEFNSQSIAESYIKARGSQLNKIEKINSYLIEAQNRQREMEEKQRKAQQLKIRKEIKTNPLPEAQEKEQKKEFPFQSRERREAEGFETIIPSVRMNVPSELDSEGQQNEGRRRNGKKNTLEFKMETLDEKSVEQLEVKKYSENKESKGMLFGEMMQAQKPGKLFENVMKNVVVTEKSSADNAGLFNIGFSNTGLFGQKKDDEKRQEKKESENKPNFELGTAVQNPQNKSGSLFPSQQTGQKTNLEGKISPTSALFGITQVPKISQMPQGQQKPKQSLQAEQKKNQPSAPIVPQAAIRPVPAAVQKLTSEQFLESYIKFASSLKPQIQIAAKLEDLSGAKQIPHQILVQAKVQINSIDRSDDKQLTAFALALYEKIVFQFINKTNVKSNLERVPPKIRTEQLEKNAINKYVMVVNLYRLMPSCQKIWVIVFGKLLKFLDFLYKRKNDLESYHKLELIQNGYVKKIKEVHSKYLSRIDFLSYMLLGLTAFDPLLILQQNENRVGETVKASAEVASWGNRWSYAEFWSLCQAIFANKHKSYSKPIVFMNILCVLYPRLFENKVNPSVFKEEARLFQLTLQKSKRYMSDFKELPEMKNLSQVDDNEGYEYDGESFVKSINVLNTRITQKTMELRYSAKQFEAKANIFYYFYFSREIR